MVEQLSLYFGFSNENSWFKISKDDKNYLQSCEVCLILHIIFFLQKFFFFPKSSPLAIHYYFFFSQSHNTFRVNFVNLLGLSLINFSCYICSFALIYDYYATILKLSMDIFNNVHFH